MKRTTFSSCDRIVPASKPLYDRKGERIRDRYYSAFHIGWASDLDWNVYLGEVVAVAVSNPWCNDESQQNAVSSSSSAPFALTKRQIQEWRPELIEDAKRSSNLCSSRAKRQQQQQRNSKQQTANDTDDDNDDDDDSHVYWRPALVLALQERTSRSSIDYMIHVQWLYRVCEFPTLLEELKSTYRVYRPTETRVQMPYVVLSSTHTACISALQILPASIQLLEKEEFQHGIDQEYIQSPLPPPLQRQQQQQQQQKDDEPSTSIQQQPFHGRFTIRLHCPKKYALSIPPQIYNQLALKNGTFNSIEQPQHSCPRLPPKPHMILETEQWSLLSSSWAVLQTRINNNNNNNNATTRSFVPVPKPLKRAWLTYGPCMDDMDLMQELIQGFTDVQNDKQNRLLLQLEQQRQNHQLDDDHDDDETSATSSFKRNRVESYETTTQQPTQKRAKTCLSTTNAKTATKRVYNKIKENNKSIIQKENVAHPTKENQLQPTPQQQAKKENKLKTRQRKAATKRAAGTSAKHKRSTATKRDSVNAARTTTSNSGSSSTQLQGQQGKKKNKNLIVDDHVKYYRQKTIPIHYDALDEKHAPTPTTLDPTIVPQSMSVRVGSVIAMQVQGIATEPPFRVPWGVAQVLAIYSTVSNQKRKSKRQKSKKNIWKVIIRWLFKESDLPKEIQQDDENTTRNTNSSSSSNAIAEMLDPNVVYEQDLDTILPAMVQITSSSLSNDIRNIVQWSKTHAGLPLLSYVCTHAYQQQQHDKVWKDTQIRDWNGKNSFTCEGPLERGFQLMERKWKLKHRLAIQAYRDALFVNKEVIKQRQQKTTRNTQESNVKDKKKGQFIATRDDFDYYASRDFLVSGESLMAVKKKDVGSTRRNPSMEYAISVQVGSVVCIPFHGNMGLDWDPFVRPWGLAQVLVICYDRTCKEWRLVIRWLYRRHELTNDLSKLIPDDDSGQDLDRILFEPWNVDDVSEIGTVLLLPAQIHMASSDEATLQPTKRMANGLPVLTMACQYMFDKRKSKRTVERIPTWTNPLSSPLCIPEPLERGFQLMQTKWKKKHQSGIAAYRNALLGGTIARQVSISTTTSKDSDETVSTTSDKMPLMKRKTKREKSTMEKRDDNSGNESATVALTTPSITTVETTTTTNTKVRALSDCVCKFGRQFFDCARITMTHNDSLDPAFYSLHEDGRSMQPGQGEQVEWTIHVGDVLPVRYILDSSSRTTKRGTKKSAASNNPWYPYKAAWSPAQVVAIYQNPMAAEDDEDKWMMEIRWFFRDYELTEHQKLQVQQKKNASQPYRKMDPRNIVWETEEYEHHSVSTCFPGRIVLTSSSRALSQSMGPLNHKVDCLWNPVPSSIPGLPLIPFFCDQMCVDEDLDGGLVNWTNYDLNMSSLPQPLLRGLGNEPSNRNQLRSSIPVRFKAYKRSIRRRKKDDIEVDFGHDQIINGAQNILTKWGHGNLDDDGCMGLDPEDTLEHRYLGLQVGTVMHSKTSPSDGDANSFVNRSFFDCLNVPLLNGNRHKSKSRKVQMFRVAIGDLVCFADSGPNQHNEQHLRKLRRHAQKHALKPFELQWSFGQVLCIYQDSVEGATTGSNDTSPSVSRIHLEIRRFYRVWELPPCVDGWVPSVEADSEEHVFETDDIVDAVPAHYILSPADLYLGAHNDCCNRWNPQVGQGAANSNPSCRCKYFYNTSMKRFQPLYSPSLSSQAWELHFRERGCLILSKLIPKCHELLSKTEAILSKGSNSRYVDTMLSKTDSPIAISQTRKGVFLTKLMCKDQNGDSVRNYYKCVTIVLDISRHGCFAINRHGGQESNAHEGTKTPSLWKLSVGNFVAKEVDISHSPILAAATITDSTPDAGVDRWYPYRVPWEPCRILAIYAGAEEPVTEDALMVIVQKFTWKQPLKSDSSVLSEIIDDATNGAIQIVPISKLVGPLLALNRQDEQSDSSTLVWGSNAAYNHLPWAPCIVDKSIVLGLRESLESLQAFASDEINRLMNDSIAGMNRNFDVGGKEDTGGIIKQEAWTHESPLYVDKSSRRVFYKSLTLPPPYDRYDELDKAEATTVLQKVTWTVNVDDTVGVHWGNGRKRSPAKVNWAGAQIVAIFRELSSTQDTSVEINGEGSFHATDEWKLEIRWFYDRSDIAGNSCPVFSSHFQEVFETDQTQVISAASLLFPVALHSDPHEYVTSAKKPGVPTPDLYCARFWSVNRKALIPCGSLEGLPNRGRLYSKCLPDKLQTSQSHSTSDGSPSSTVGRLEPSWEASFGKVIRKLTLKDASSLAYEHGEGLIGREKELGKIVSFLKEAIRGDTATGRVKSAMFLAGPPGVGKTACVRAAIAQLRRDQSKGEMGSFTFVPLNGMEMRYPLDAYARLWEALTGNAVHPEIACRKLEDYFTLPFCSDEPSVTVVLVDEIDYLVTERQSVLYNFFDWPKRAAQLVNGRRLIVIGISNTLNLIDNLLPSVQSRVGSERCRFKAYNLQETTSILKSKIREASPDLSIFEDDAIMFAAKKTAAISGDIRKAFQICRAAAERVLNEATGGVVLTDVSKKADKAPPVVRILDVQRASKESFSTALLNAISFSTPFQALALVALASLCRTTGREFGGFEINEVVTKMAALAAATGDPQYSSPPSFSETIYLLNRIGESNLVQLTTPTTSGYASFRSAKAGSCGTWAVVSLGVDESTILRGLKGSPHRLLAEKNLQAIA